ncbi:MAG: tetratricopeptide repeat protein [Polaromonas sp.]|nr:tetratricopeptide repeat protein [Polaromonas sp.]
MGLLDRLLKTKSGHVSDTKIATAAGPSEAERLLEEGVTLEARGQPEEALNRYEVAIGLKPELARAHFNRGNILLDKGDAAGALAAYEQAVTYKPDSAAAYYNIGSAHLHLGNAREAIAACRQAITLKPDFADAHVSLNMALGSESRDLGKFDEAEASYRRALEINPRLAEAHHSLGILFGLTNRVAESVASFEQALRTKGDYAEAHTSLLFFYNYVADLAAEQLLRDARRFGEVAARLAQPYTRWKTSPDPLRVLRVGFVSGDLRDHPVGCFLEGVLAALTSRTESRLELFAYPTFTCDDETSARLRACCKDWYSAVGLSDETLARRITEDGIDILIDLSGHTAHNRLTMFAWKPAPVQLTWLGYLATTGLAAIDYVIADEWTLPKDQEAYFTEKVWRLPESYICFTPPLHEALTGPLPSIGNGYITFGSCNNLTKMNDDVVALWARVLHTIPNSRLLLKSKQLQAVFMRQNVVNRFGVHGIDAERLILKAHVSRGEYLMTYCEIDIALDPFPYPGITTSVESLWMGVPVLTLSGEQFLSRQGVGLLMNAGLPDWIATDTDDYLARAVSHASDLQRLAALRGGLRKQVLDSPVFDAPRFAQHFEVALREMWQKWCAQHPGSSQNRETNGAV